MECAAGHQAAGNDAHRLPARALIGFGAGSIGTGVLSNVPAVLLLIYMTDALGIPAGWAGVGIFVPKFLDALFDPLMGFVSDRTRSRWGRRRPYMLTGAVLCSVSFLFLFTTPALPSTLATFAYTTTCFVVLSLAYSVFAVPYIAMPAEMSASALERTRITTYRMAFAMVGLLLGAFLAPLAVAWFGHGREGHAGMALLFAAICLVTMMATVSATRGLEAVPGAANTVSLRAQVASALRERSYLVLQLSYVLVVAGVAAMMAAAGYLVTYTLERAEDVLGWLFLSLFGVGLLTIPVWPWLARRYGTAGAYTYAIALFAVASLSLAFVTRHYPLPALLAQVTLLGAAVAGLQVGGFSLLTDVINLDADRSGLRREGLFTGLWIASEKLGAAIGPLLVGVVLDLAGFVEAGGRAAQPAAVQSAIIVCFCLLPAGLMGLAALTVRRLPADLRRGSSN